MADKIYKNRLFLFKDLNEEEAWINSFREKGYRLCNIHFGFHYTFEKFEAYVPITRIDFREFSNKEEESEYLQLFTDMGWIQIKNFSGQRYFQQISQSTDEFIYSSNKSFALMYKRYSKFAFSMMTMFLFYFFIFYSIGTFNPIFEPKEAYLTPGLWEMSGLQFIRAFLFETPFALMRIVGNYFFLIMAVYLTYIGYKNHKKYVKLSETER